MPRLARIIVPGFPHHVTQRGSRNQIVFFSNKDKENYLSIFEEELSKLDVKIWAYCLMDNHVHFIVVPGDETSLSKLFREAHKRYAAMINRREGWRGHLWQERFHSFVMDERHLFSAMRYVEMNPVKANMVEDPDDYAWSSAHFHVKKVQSRLISQCHLTNEIEDWKSYLVGDKNSEYEKNAQKHLSTGRPLGSPDFIKKLETLTKRSLSIKESGRKPIINNDLVVVE